VSESEPKPQKRSAQAQGQLLLGGELVPPTELRAERTSELRERKPPESADCHYARVALFVPLSNAYSFSIPDSMRTGVHVGARVLCGLRGRQVFGVVLEAAFGNPGCPIERLQPLLAVVAEQPAVPGELLCFLQELADYYLAPIGEVMRLAVPALERSAAAELEQQGLGVASARSVGRLTWFVERVEATSAGEKTSDQTTPHPPLRGQTLALFSALAGRGAVKLAELEGEFPNARAAAQRLTKLGLCRLEKRSDLQTSSDSAVERDTPPALNTAQSSAVAALCARLEAGGPHNFLLHGVTASGKTEVYLHAVSRCLELGGGALVLVPEIALTPQLLSRFRARLGDTIAVLHSGLGTRERTAMWKRLRSGELKVALGARSALFAPVENLRLLCVDEEQDSSFKQEEGVRYNARDMALLRALRAGAVCVLGSATPSLKSFHAVQTNKLERLSLPSRAHQDAILPEVEVVDLRRHGPGPTGDRWLSLPLYRALERVLERKEQGILFLNRRGFAPSVRCHDCGVVLGCPSCEVPLTYHVKPAPHVICHYCDFRAAAPDRCRQCNSPALGFDGLGTERVEEALRTSFPEARIARLDRDTGAGLKSEGLLRRMQARELDLLVGTQMVTKGHDLPGVTLVGVLNGDAGLSLPDYQASERTFQLLVQVAGRAGRAGARGRVLVQTYTPEHPAIALALAHDVLGFARYALADRATFNYPPFSRLALVRISSLEENVARSTAEVLADRARAAAADRAEILGPAPAPLPRLRNQYRFRFMVRSPSRAALRHVLTRVGAAKVDGRVRVVLDIDPGSML
jgi:primosomal protein N' (replication factor Y) (superfamily II helicase)